MSDSPNDQLIVCGACQASVRIPNRLWGRGLQRPCPKCKAPLVLGPAKSSGPVQTTSPLVAVSNTTNLGPVTSIQTDPPNGNSPLKSRVVIYAVSGIAVLGLLFGLAMSMWSERSGSGSQESDTPEMTRVPSTEESLSPSTLRKATGELKDIQIPNTPSHRDLLEIAELQQLSRICARNASVDFIVGFGLVGMLDCTSLDSLRNQLAESPSITLPKDLSSVHVQAKEFLDNTLGTGPADTWFRIAPAKGISSVLDPDLGDYAAAAGNDVTVARMLAFDAALQHRQSEWWKIVQSPFNAVYSQAPIIDAVLTVRVADEARPVVPFGQNEAIKSNEMCVVVSNMSGQVLDGVILVIDDQTSTDDGPQKTHVFFFDRIEPMTSIPLLTQFETVTPEGRNRLPRTRREFDGFDSLRNWKVRAMVGESRIPAAVVALQRPIDPKEVKTKSRVVTLGEILATNKHELPKENSPERTVRNDPSITAESLPQCTNVVPKFYTRSTPGKVFDLSGADNVNVAAVWFSNDGKYVFFASRGTSGDVYVWEVHNGKRVSVQSMFASESGPRITLSQAPTGTKLAYMLYDRLSFVDLESGKRTAELEIGAGGEGDGGCIAWAPTGKKVVVGDRRSGRVCVVESTGEISSVYELGKGVHSVAFNGDESKICFASGYESRVWNFTKKDDSVAVCDIHDSPVLRISHHSNPEWMMSLAGDEATPVEIAVWDTASGKTVARRRYGVGMRCSTMSKDWRRLACVESGGALVTYDTATGTEECRFENAVSAKDEPLVALSPCGTLAAILNTSSESVSLWKLPAMPAEEVPTSPDSGKVNHKQR